MRKHVSLLGLSTFSLFLAASTLPALSPSASAQTAPPNPDAQIVTTQTAPTRDDDSNLAPHNPNATPAHRSDEAWSMLTTNIKDSKHPDRRIQALSAIGTLGANPMGLKLIAATMDDSDVDVRTAAVLAAGQTRSRNLSTDLRRLLDDKEPQVAFTAAITLWKMDDRSGEDILMAVVDGERTASASMMNGTRHSAGKTLRSPAALARIGALQGASYFLGPFGLGITAIEYMRKNGSATGSARVLAIQQLSEQKTDPLRAELIAALADKDSAVRAAAAQAIGSFHEPSTSIDLYKLLDDSKAPVRLTAAAAYINSTSATLTIKKRRAAPRPTTNKK